MQPAISQILRGMKWSLKTEIFPLLDDPRAQSSVYCMELLLDHILLRLDTECPALNQENLELVEALIQFKILLEENHLHQTHQKIGKLQAELEKVMKDHSNKRYEITNDSVLHQENANLKRLFSRVIKCVQHSRDEIPVDLYNRLMGQIDELLRKQLNRDSEWITPVFVGKPF